VNAVVDTILQLRAEIQLANMDVVNRIPANIWKDRESITSQGMAMKEEESY
jgi:hypothetical protein